MLGSSCCLIHAFLHFLSFVRWPCTFPIKERQTNIIKKKTRHHLFCEPSLTCHHHLPKHVPQHLTQFLSYRRYSVKFYWIVFFSCSTCPVTNLERTWNRCKSIAWRKKTCLIRTIESFLEPTKYRRGTAGWVVECGHRWQAASTLTSCGLHPEPHALGNCVLVSSISNQFSAPISSKWLGYHTGKIKGFT